MAKKILTTAKGIAVWPKVNEPDTKFDANGVYQIKLRLEGEDAVALRNQLDQAVAANLEELKKDAKLKGKKIKNADAPYQIETGDDEQETGAIIFNFKMKAKGTRKDGTTFTAKPLLFDNLAKPLAADKRVGGGSVVKIGYEVNPFYVAAIGAGVSLRLKAVQVLELREFGGDASAFGFSAEEAEEADMSEAVDAEATVSVKSTGSDF